MTNRQRSYAIWYRKSLAVRIALASAFFGFLLNGGAIVFGFYALSYELDARSVTNLSGKRDLLVHVLYEMPSLDAISQNRHRFNDLLIGHDDLHLAVVNPVDDRTIEAFSAIGGESLTSRDSFTNSPTTVREWRATTGELLTTVSGSSPVANGMRVRYYLSLNRRNDTQLLTGFVKTTLVGWPIFLLIVALGAWLIARTSLAPLRRFHRLAETTGAQSLGQRISSAGLPSELYELAEEFNRMLGRIDSGYQRLKDFSGELAHEMRTPIATLMGRTQVALSKSRTNADFREVLEGNIEEFERLARLVSDMLFIASTDHTENPLNHEHMELAQEAQGVVDYLSLVAEERGLTVKVAGAAAVMADRLLVGRAITNLLSNAIRHAKAGSTIGLAVSEETGGASLTVTNYGDAIAQDLLERIFDRFYRIESGHTSLDGRTGLGLAIVRSIMQAHGGEVTAHSQPSGKVSFRLQFLAVVSRT